MQVASKRIGAIFAAACVFFALAFGVSYAVAAGEFPADGANSLTVHATNSTEQDFKDDIANANVQVDVYKIASAAKDTQYVVYNYTSLIEGLNLPGADAKAADWGNFAKEAAKKVLSDAGDLKVKENLPVETPYADMDDGLFLILPHGDGITPKLEGDELAGLEAYSTKYIYTFEPSITAAPTKEPMRDSAGNIIYDETGVYPVINTAASAGEWTRAIEVSLKPEQKPAYGKLRITKTVTDNTESKLDSTFTFHIVGTTPEGAKQGKTNDYDNYAQVMYTNGEVKDAVITMIPAGTTGTVTEVNSGAGFESEVENGDFTIVMDDEHMATVEFKNTRDQPKNPTYGIQNNFEVTGFDSEGNATWEWKGANEEANAHEGL